jgi:uncharacterized lipoprotein YddW (UPF0748 family)
MKPMTKKLMKQFFLLIGLLAVFFPWNSLAETLPKREFRGVWIHTVGNTRYKTMSREAIMKEWSDMLDSFQHAGMNAVIFQVRPQADAFYKSGYEPWSHYLTGKQGVAPSPEWDPLAFMIEACHKRGMQLHAWLNPYRVTSRESDELDKINKKHSKLFVKYGTQLFFDPGQPESRKIVNRVVKDIVSRYDVDGIHFDDYFYPYPVKGEDFPDHVSFKKYAKKQGFTKEQIGDWRRHNVDQLIEEVAQTVKETKPWVVFGVSPFGIYRNQSETPDGSGSKTNGLSNYGQLYADVLLWQQKGWIDYVAPQLYWKIGHKSADYATLVDWWSKNAYATNLYIGQNIMTFREKDLKDTLKTQFAEKMRLTRETPNINGNIWWSGYQMKENPFGSLDTLARHYQKYPAFIPLYRRLSTQTPQPVTGLRCTIDNCKLKLVWNPAETKDELEKSLYFCVYRFEMGEKADFNDATRIVSITSKPEYIITDSGKRSTYVVTSLNRLFLESLPSESVSTGN